VLGTKTFAKSADVAGTARYRVTSRGNRIAESPKGEELAIEEIVWFAREPANAPCAMGRQELSMDGVDTMI